jgi:hypothetical protein
MSCIKRTAEDAEVLGGLAARAEREGIRALLGDLVTIVTVIPGHSGLGTVTGLFPDGMLEVTDAQRRAAVVPAAGVVIESSVMDEADELTPAEARKLARFLPPGVTSRTAEFEDLAAAVAVRRILAVTL